MLRRIFLQVLVLTVALSSGTSVLLRPYSVGELQRYSFGRFVKDFGRTYRPGSNEWKKRNDIFDKNMKEVIGFIVGTSRSESWSKGVTKFMDYSPGEFTSMLGYKGRRGSKDASGSVEMYHENKGMRIPTVINLALNSTLGSVVKDQGGCGSCWAEAATSTMEFYMERDLGSMLQAASAMSTVRKSSTLSVQTVVSCTQNPRHCGGMGGCEGATPELAYAMVQQKGLPFAVDWPYESGFGQVPPCNDGVFHQRRLGISGYKVLPPNRMGPLKRALAENGGPVAVSVDGSNWAFYSSGIYTDYEGEFNLNHNVVLMGFHDTTPDQKGYWLIKNSWSSGWGENGYIRLEMKDNEEEHCGQNDNPQLGVGCDGGPDTTWVCGTCGILYDSTYPTGLFLMDPSLI